MRTIIKAYSFPISLCIALAAMLGSLYFSEVLHQLPCLLCWYQRIAMYPLVIILAVGIARKDSDCWRYALPFSIIGTFIGIYHVLVTYGIIKEAASCAVGVSCAAITWSVFGFITIPFLSMIAFILITILLLLYRK